MLTSDTGGGRVGQAGHVRQRRQSPRQLRVLPTLVVERAVARLVDGCVQLTLGLWGGTTSLQAPAPGNASGGSGQWGQVQGAQREAPAGAGCLHGVWGPWVTGTARPSS